MPETRAWRRLTKFGHFGHVRAWVVLRTLITSIISGLWTMSKFVMLGLFLFVAFAASPASAAPHINFGDDAGDYSNDGECDDPRFDGPEMTTTALIEADITHDATDCRNGFEAGKLTLRGVDAKGKISFGNDDGEYSNDGECDDPRFGGPGMTTTALIQDDLLHDATDCRTAYEAGTIKLR